jgi:hypothetical protein
MVSPVLNEQFYDGAFLVSEANGHMSRDPGVLDNSSGSDVLFEGGLIVNEITTGTETSAHGTNTGNGTIGAVSLGALDLFGTYNIVFTSVTEFNVVDPTGAVIGTGATGTPFVGPVDFTITAGSTPFIVGDTFTITVTQQAPSWVSWTGGTITKLAILFNRVIVSAGTSKDITLIIREAEVNTAELQWDAAVLSSGSVASLQAQALASLALANIIAR